MMKLDTNFKRKIGMRSTNAGLAAIFLAGIVFGIVLTVVAIASLPDASPGNPMPKSRMCDIQFKYLV